MQPLNAAEIDGANLTQHKEEAESLRKELKIKNKKVENKQAECDLLMKLLQLHEENQRTMRDLLTLKENLETKTKELETIKAAWLPVSVYC
ncbi:disheveled-associated activator of morphogenesis 1-A-like [Scomber japonicus]|uniref:disheveled-associated activator of morphogenesis 1-A-like n=1 Tax=Scomber japonicus TaxID=13676 RepID=UPI0023052883|nr:disheveled-associated activator of morphogenesis 1-A-like [Scomber japonicus]